MKNNKYVENILNIIGNADQTYKFNQCWNYSYLVNTINTLIDLRDKLEEEKEEESIPYSPNKKPDWMKMEKSISIPVINTELFQNNDILKDLQELTEPITNVRNTPDTHKIEIPKEDIHLQFNPTITKEDVINAAYGPNMELISLCLKSMGIEPSQTTINKTEKKEPTMKVANPIKTEDDINMFLAKYNVGDVVLFKTKLLEEDDRIFAGIIEGYYLDNGYFWYNIKVNNKFVFSYSSRGDIAEWDIIAKLEGELKNECFELIKKGW